MTSIDSLRSPGSLWGDQSEWLEADGIGGFASGTASGVRTRRYHALLLAATTPPTGRMVLVNGFDAWVTTPAGRFALTTQRYSPDVLHPDGHRHLVSFASEPWPSWEYETPDGVRVVQEVVVAHGGGGTVVTWRVTAAEAPIMLEVRPFFSGRDYHSMHHENGAFAFEPEVDGDQLTWRVYQGLPPIRVSSNGAYLSRPDWYRHFLYTAERERGLDDREDLASPGVFTWTLESAGTEAVLVLSALVPGVMVRDTPALEQARTIRGSERQRRSLFAAPLDRAADAYLVRRGSGRTIVAGYPWFTDWGRDTFIAIRGLCIATGRFTDARDIMLEWAGAVSEGMLPNRFADASETPEFSAVDASLWFVIAVHDLLDRVGSGAASVCEADRARLQHAVQQIVQGYAQGTRYRIHADTDGLLAAGEPGVQLTWMDARVDGREVTPRIGKPVEVQALWLNALWIASQNEARWAPLYASGRRSFAARFWNAERSCLYDVVDENHVPGCNDETIRPNQILAVGGLPLAMIDGDRARAVVDVVERELVTPFGLRSLAPGEASYAARYEGGPSQRDGIYHQGIVWPWLMGPFVDAWVRVHGGTESARREARSRFVEPLLEYVSRNGQGHLWEITDAEPPYQGRGCPFQAWSLGELIRVERELL
jgi:predicted glycogen debranching enzyme